MSTNQPATPATPDPPPLNKDRITPPVLSRAVILGVVGLLAAFGIHLNVSETQAGALSDLAIVLIPLLSTLAGAAWGALQARDRVTPIGPGDTPRDADGVKLIRGEHAPATGYPQRQRRRVDRRKVDRDPDASY